MGVLHLATTLTAKRLDYQRKFALPINLTYICPDKQFFTQKPLLENKN